MALLRRIDDRLKLFDQDEQQLPKYKKKAARLAKKVDRLKAEVAKLDAELHAPFISKYVTRPLDKSDQQGKPKSKKRKRKGDIDTGTTTSEPTTKVQKVTVPKKNGAKGRRKKAEQPDPPEYILLKKKATLEKLEQEYRDLVEKIRGIESGDARNAYWLQSAPFLAAYEHEDKFEQEERRVSKQRKGERQALASFLNVLPKRDKTRPNTKVNNVNNGNPVNDTVLPSFPSLGDVTGTPCNANNANANNATNTSINLTHGSPPVVDELNSSSSSDDPIGVPAWEGQNLFARLTNAHPSAAHTAPETKKKEIYAEFMAEVEGDVSKRQELRSQERNEFFCSDPACGGEVVEDGKYLRICRKCGLAECYVQNEELGTFSENPRIHVQPVFSYKRKNHFRDWLARIQAKENTTIPQEVFDAVRNELKKMRIRLAKDVTRKTIRGLLKKLKMAAYYENISQIQFLITGKEPPRFTRHQEGVLMGMFMQLEPVYEKVKPPDRNNFFSYEYVIHKFCQILYEWQPEQEDWEVKRKVFKLLRGRDRLYNQDLMWKACCTELNWPFIRSIT